MNILFLNTGLRNYGPDSIYIGLRRLGHAVEDRPRKGNLHSHIIEPLDIGSPLNGIGIMADL